MTSLTQVYPAFMAETKYVLIRLRGRDQGAWLVDPTLRDRLLADAQTEGTSITNVAMSILANRVKVPYVASGRTSEPKAAADQLNVRVPMLIYDAYRAMSPSERGMQDVMRKTLSDHYGLDVPEKQKRVRAAA